MPEGKRIPGALAPLVSGLPMTLRRARALAAPRPLLTGGLLLGALFFWSYSPLAATVGNAWARAIVACIIIAAGALADRLGAARAAPAAEQSHGALWDRLNPDAQAILALAWNAQGSVSPAGFRRWRETQLITGGRYTAAVHELETEHQLVDASSVSDGNGPALGLLDRGARLCWWAARAGKLPRVDPPRPPSLWDALSKIERGLLVHIHDACGGSIPEHALRAWLATHRAEKRCDDVIRHLMGLGLLEDMTPEGGEGPQVPQGAIEERWALSDPALYLLSGAGSTAPGHEP
jgi:hypothetical protein